jgi:hypothetical protein
MNYNQAQERVHDLKNLQKHFMVCNRGFYHFFDDIFEKGIFNISQWNGSIILAIWELS